MCVSAVHKFVFVAVLDVIRLKETENPGFHDILYLVN